MTWNLPLLLLLLCETYHFGYYQIKIQRIIEHQINREIVSFIPSRHVNRLYLYLALRKFNQTLFDIDLKKYLTTLEELIDYSIILEEFKDKEIFCDNGISGLILLIEYFNGDVKSEKINKLSDDMVNTLIRSSYWNVESGKSFTDNSFDLSLINGISGIGIALIIKRLNSSKS